MKHHYLTPRIKTAPLTSATPLLDASGTTGSKTLPISEGDPDEWLSKGNNSAWSEEEGETPEH